MGDDRPSILPNPMRSVTIPRSVILLDWGVSLILMAAARTTPRLIYDTNWLRWTKGRTKTAAIIVGANKAGEVLLRGIRRNPELGYRPIGFVDGQRQDRHRAGRAGGEILGHAAVFLKIRSAGENCKGAARPQGWA